MQFFYFFLFLFLILPCDQKQYIDLILTNILAFFGSFHPQDFDAMITSDRQHLLRTPITRLVKNEQHQSFQPIVWPEESAIQMPSTWAVNFILYLPRFAPGTEVPPALLRGLLPWHAAGGPLRVGTVRGRRRCLHRAEAAAGGDGGDTLPLSTKQKWEEIWRNDLPDV